MYLAIRDFVRGPLVGRLVWLRPTTELGSSEKRLVLQSSALLFNAVNPPAYCVYRWRQDMTCRRSSPTTMRYSPSTT